MPHKTLHRNGNQKRRLRTPGKVVAVNRLLSFHPDNKNFQLQKKQISTTLRLSAILHFKDKFHVAKSQCRV